MIAPRSGVACCLTVAACAACQIIGGFDDFQPASRDGGRADSGRADSGRSRASAGGSGGAIGHPDACPAERDPGTHGPGMAQVMRPSGSCFWMDTTEVTVSMYSEFLGVPHAAQSDVCAWNVASDATAQGGLAPEPSCVRSVRSGITLDGGPRGTLPMSCVDWCDALAFCIWAGKDLCGDDGDAPATPSKSDWFQACSEGDPARLYGCGSRCSAATCNGSASQSGSIAPVGTLSGCAVASAGGGESIHDLSGNVSEWTRSCKPATAAGECVTRGGSYDSPDSALECATTAPLPRARALPTVGFRCCAESGRSGDSSTRP